MQTKDYSPKVWESLQQLHTEVLKFCFVNVTKFNPQKAQESLLKCAEFGYADSYFTLGEIYYNGLLGEKDVSKAKEFYLRGEMVGNVKCKYGLAKCEEDAENQHSRYANIFQSIFDEAGKNKDVISRYLLARYFEKGLGGQEVNVNAAVYWTSLSALGGYTLAQRKLAEFCLYGRGIEQSLSEAKEWYAKAASGGLAVPVLEEPETEEQENQSAEVTEDNIEDNTNVEKAEIAEETTENADVENIQEPTETVSATADESAKAPINTTDNLRLSNEPEQDELAIKIGEQLKDLYKEEEITPDYYNQYSAEENPITKNEDGFPPMPKSEIDKFVEKHNIKSSTLISLARAAHLGDAEAQYNLAVIFEVGNELPKNYDVAFEWYCKSAEQGYPKAQNNLGLYYQLGIATPKDVNIAVDLYRQAAKQGYSHAEYNLGQCYLNSMGVRHSYIEAARFLDAAAKQGHAAAQYSLGVLYETGKGVVRDYVKAYDCYKQASKGGIVLAEEKLFDLGKKMRILGIEPSED